MTIYIPYDLIERIAGTWVADHFNELSAAVLFCGAVYFLLFRSGGNNGPRTTY